jgi:hypothetical protein
MAEYQFWIRICAVFFLIGVRSPAFAFASARELDKHLPGFYSTIRVDDLSQCVPCAEGKSTLTASRCLKDGDESGECVSVAAERHLAHFDFIIYGYINSTCLGVGKTLCAASSSQYISPYVAQLLSDTSASASASASEMILSLSRSEWNSAAWGDAPRRFHAPNRSFPSTDGSEDDIDGSNDEDGRCAGLKQEANPSPHTAMRDDSESDLQPNSFTCRDASPKKNGRGREQRRTVQTPAGATLQGTSSFMRSLRRRGKYSSDILKQEEQQREEEEEVVEGDEEYEAAISGFSIHLCPSISFRTALNQGVSAFASVSVPVSRRPPSRPLIEQRRALGKRGREHVRKWEEEDWEYMHNPGAALSGECLHKWLSALLPSSERVGRERENELEPESESLSAQRLVRLLSSVQAGVALANSPWAEVSFRLKTHNDHERKKLDSRNSSSSSSSNGENEAFITRRTIAHIEVRVSLMLLPKHISTHDALLRDVLAFSSRRDKAHTVGIASLGNIDQTRPVPDKTVAVKHEDPPRMSPSLPPPVKVERRVFADSTGHLISHTIIDVGGAAAALSSALKMYITVSEPVPAFAEPMLHTYMLSHQNASKIDLSNAAAYNTHAASSSSSSSSSPSSSSVSVASLPTFYLKSIANANDGHRTNSHHLAKQLQSPIRSVLHWSVEVRENTTYDVQLTLSARFLSREQHSPDSSRGREYPPAFVAVLWVDNHTETEGLVVTSAPLVMLPLPDFSMPFNVLTLGTTALAFFIGSLVNAVFAQHPSIAAIRNPKGKIA